MGFLNPKKITLRSFPFRNDMVRGGVAAPQSYKRFGKLVELTQCQYDNLLLDLGSDEEALLKLIDDFDLYMITHGIKYQNHYKVLKRKVDDIHQQREAEATDYYRYGRFGVL